MRAVIVNPAAASGRTERRWRRIVDALRAGGGGELEVLVTTCAGDAIALTRRAIADGFDELVVLGGDGTVGEVVAGCLRADGSGMAASDGLRVSIVHQGTGGDLVRGLGIPVDEDAAIDAALGSHSRAIDVGVASWVARDGSRHVRGFASCANVGMSADVVERVEGRLKRLGRTASFAAATVACLARNRPRRMAIRTDRGADDVLDVVDVVVANNRFMGGGMLVAPAARMDDGLLDLVVIRSAGRLRLLRTFPKIYGGTHVDDPLVRVQPCTSVTIDGAPGGDGPPARHRLVLDGELVGHTPVTFGVVPRGLRVGVAAPL